MILPRGLLIAIEGIDGAGKTTQAEAVAARLRQVNLEVVVTHEPTRGPWGQRLRASATTGRLSPEDELHAFLEDRKEHVRDLIGPALAAGKVVIVDRYYFSSAAYQGARGMDPQQILDLNQVFAPVPDLLVLLQVEPRIALQRIRRRDDRENLFEREEDLQKVHGKFCEMAFNFLQIIDGTLDPNSITTAILDRFHDQAVFRILCQKITKASCEPEYCTIRLAGECGLMEYGSLVARLDHTEALGILSRLLPRILPQGSQVPTDLSAIFQCHDDVTPRNHMSESDTPSPKVDQ